MRKFALVILIVLLGCMVAGCEQGFAIKGVSPAVGVLGGGEPVVIRGTGFNPNLGVAVYFGNSKADNVVVSATDKLIVTSPSAGEPKVVDVRIAMDDGKEYLLKGAFRYIEKTNMDIRDLGKRQSLRKKQ